MHKRANAMKNGPYFYLSLALMLLANRICYGLGRFLGQSRPHHDLSLLADALFPFLPWTISVYFGCFLFWVLMYRRIAHLTRKKSDRFFCANLLAKGICFLFFVFLPTTNVRPEVTGTTVWDALMRFLYQIDAPDNLFPSIHCMISWLCWVGVRKSRDIPFPLRGAALLMAVAVCLSTLTTRQHVLPDVAGGVLLAETCYLAAGAPKLLRAYAAFIDSALSEFRKAEGCLPL